MKKPEASAVVTATPRPARPIERNAASVRPRFLKATKAASARKARPATCVVVPTESSRCSPPAVDQATAAAAMYSCPRRRVLTAGARESALLAGVQQPLRVEHGLDRAVQRERSRRPLLLEPAALHEAEAVLPGDAPAEPSGQVEELLRRRLGADALRLVARIDHER